MFLALHISVCLSVLDVYQESKLRSRVDDESIWSTTGLGTTGIISGVAGGIESVEDGGDIHNTWVGEHMRLYKLL